MKSQTIRIYTENATFQQIEVLRRNREKRHRQGQFLVEGVRMINLAVERGWTVSAWLYSHERKLSEWAGKLLKSHLAPIHYELSAPLLEKLSGKSETSELLALVAMPADELARIPLHPALLVVVFDRPANPGNLGSIIRSCDALGVHGLIISGHAVDLYDPEVISATVGTLFTLPIVRLPASTQLEPWLELVRSKLGNLQVVGSSAKAEMPIFAQDWRSPTVLIVGNETSGMSAHYRQLCDAIVTIPIAGAASSLNVASATSILLYEVARQRRPA